MQKAHFQEGYWKDLKAFNVSETFFHVYANNPITPGLLLLPV